MTAQAIKAAADEIASRFKPQRIVLFGSYAYGVPTEDSDVDLLVLLNGKHVHDRALDICHAIRFGFPVDLIARSPEEFERRIGCGDCFLTEIRDKGTVLYEAAHTRMGKKDGGRLRNRPAGTPRKEIAPFR